MLKKRVRVPDRALTSALSHRNGRGGKKSINGLEANVTSVLTVALLVIWVVIGSGTVAVAASAGNGAAGATFGEHCATCHASNGSGDTAVGKSVKIPDLRSPAVQSQSDAQLAEIIADGKGAMPPFKSSLSKDEIDALAKHVHGLAKTK